MKKLLFIISLLLLSSTIFALPGDLDTTFGVKGGYLITDVGGVQRDERHRDTAVQVDGKIVVVGTRETATANFFDLLVARFNTDGTPDTTFDGDGIKLFDFQNISGSEHFHDVVSQVDGKVIGIVSYLTDNYPTAISDDFYVVRVNPDGTTDNSFDANGVVKSQWCEDGSEIALQTDGKIVAIGSHDRLDDTEYNHGICVQRFNTDGSVDSSLNSTPSNGKAVLSQEGLIEVLAVAGLPNGKILVAGSRDRNGFIDAMLIRLNANGMLDTSFMNEGFYVRSSSSTGSPFYFYSLKVLSDGSFFLGGDSQIVKFTSAGVLDTAFSGDGIANPAVKVRRIAIQPDGKILGCGLGTSVGRIARISATGTIEASPDVNMGVPGSESGIFGCGLQSDGKIIVAGYGRDSLNNNDNVVVSRLLTNLSVDTNSQQPICPPL